jgi:hypothetical protein
MSAWWQRYSLVVQVTGADALSPGDLAAVSGVTGPVPGGNVPMPLVRLADAATYNGVIGVVESRMVWEAAPGKEAEGEMSMHSADGPAQPGEYVSLVVFGIAQVKVDPAILITPGERLTASSLAGMARPLMTQDVNGMLVVEGAPVIGIAWLRRSQAKDPFRCSSPALGGSHVEKKLIFLAAGVLCLAALSATLARIQAAPDTGCPVALQPPLHPGGL